MPRDARRTPLWSGALTVPLARLVPDAWRPAALQVCPLTPLAEELGAGSGSVVDIFLHDWFSRRIPMFGGSDLLLGVALSSRALHGRIASQGPA